MYLPFTARLTVDSCMPIFSAITPRLSGFSADGPLTKSSSALPSLPPAHALKSCAASVPPNDSPRLCHARRPDCVRSLFPDPAEAHFIHRYTRVTCCMQNIMDLTVTHPNNGIRNNVMWPFCTSDGSTGLGIETCNIVIGSLSFLRSHA